jgi:hypothetical protein
MLRLLLVFLVCGVTVQVHASPERFVNGHNLSITSDQLKPAHLYLGSDVIGVGVTDWLSLGTSTFLWSTYNTASVAARIRTPYFNYQVSYFQSYRDRTEVYYGYQMRSLWNQFVYTFEPEADYRLHFNVHLNYYFDEKMPFSLRRPYLTPTPFQLNVSLLHEVNIAGSWVILGEVGVLDLLRHPIHLHTGASIGQSNGWFLWHIGFSLSASKDALLSPVERRDYQQTLLQTEELGFNGKLDPKSVALDYAIHPEIGFGILF